MKHKKKIVDLQAVVEDFLIPDLPEGFATEGWATPREWAEMFEKYRPVLLKTATAMGHEGTSLAAALLEQGVAPAPNLILYHGILFGIILANCALLEEARAGDGLNDAIGGRDGSKD